MNEKKSNDIGKIWLNTNSQTGEEFMSGEITIDGKKTFIKMYQNDRKQPGDKQPLFKFYLDKKKNQATQQTFTDKPSPIDEEDCPF